MVHTRDFVLMMIEIPVKLLVKLVVRSGFQSGLFVPLCSLSVPVYSRFVEVQHVLRIVEVVFSF